MGITKKQREVFDYIQEYWHTHGYAPTQKEIKDHFGFKSFGSVQRYIQYLVNAGYLKNSWNERRGLEPADLRVSTNTLDPATFEIPMLGKVAAGLPIEAVEQNETISVPMGMIGSGEHFALLVQGQSMIDDGILDGDVIVVKSKETANNGETIVALVENEATVKRYYKRKNEIELQPANSTMNSIIVRGGEFKIAGIVIGLIRTF